MDLLSANETVLPVCAGIYVYSVRWVTDSLIRLYDKKIPIALGYEDFQ